MSSSAGVSSNRNRRTAYAAAAAAKERRQKIIAALLGVVLLAVLAYEVPQLLKTFRGSKDVTPVATAPTPAKLTPSDEGILNALRRKPAVDPFAQPIPTGSDPAPRNVAVPPNSVDPFTGRSSRSPAQRSAPPALVGPLPERVIIGKPGGGRVAKHGWIVILASIPTRQGKASATSYAVSARKRGFNPVSVLNSSNRKPLRGGYWVVYTGPYATLKSVTGRARNVQARGYPTAYIRELIVYR